MGCSTMNAEGDLNGSNVSTLSSTVTRNRTDYSSYSYNEFKFKAWLRKMFLELGFACIFPKASSSSDGENVGSKGANLEEEEDNKAWLLAESGGCGAELSSADPQCVHSSFRFSICSTVELESLNLNQSSSATVLMVNLDSYDGFDSSSRESKWRRIVSLERSISPAASALIRFGYDQIVSATNNFSEARILGRGALSCVFRGRVGFLRSSIAIKRLDKEDKEASKAFCRELMIASSLQNVNIVPLVGFCIDQEEGLFLVYKYVSGGSLEHHLHVKKTAFRGDSSLPWAVRYKVAVGIAEAIAYLHNGTERCIVHRDIKPSNILLSSRRNPKLCDFGLATWTTAPSIPFLCKTVKGTFGYLAPEYFQHGKVSDKTDVYAFGVVLLELITGRKPIEAKRPPGEENLVLWAKPLLQLGKESIKELIDPRPKVTLGNSTKISRMVEATAVCINYEESQRPNISEIIATLRGEEKLACIKKSGASVNGCVFDCYTQSHNSKSEMKGHLALAMLDVSEFEDNDHVYCR